MKRRTTVGEDVDQELAEWAEGKTGVDLARWAWADAPWRDREAAIAAGHVQDDGRASAVATGAWLTDARPWRLFWTQTWRPSKHLGDRQHSLDYCKRRMWALLDEAARSVARLPRRDVDAGAVYGWCSWELTKARAWHAHLLVAGIESNHWREVKELAFYRDGIARVYPIERGEEREREAKYVAKYVCKGPETFDVFGSWDPGLFDWSTGHRGEDEAPDR